MKSYFIVGGSGARIYVEEEGNVHGRPIIFIHGFSQSHFCWRNQMQSSLSKYFRLITFDLRGHGFSDKPVSGYDNPQNWADDIQGIIGELDLIEPLLVGWSLGGLVVCDYLRIYGEKYIGGINFVNASTMIGVKKAMEFSTTERRDLTSGLTSEFTEESIEALKNFIGLCFYRQPDTEDFHFILGYNSLVPPYVRQEIVSRKISSDEVLQKITKPVLITHGQEDRIIKPESSLHISSLVKHGKKSFYPLTGHTPFWENPAKFNKEIKSFLESI